MTAPRTIDMPSAGRLEGAIHKLAVRVYYEDTDASGIVYHANYLRYMERGRSDLTRMIGFDQQAMLAKPEGERLFFAVRSVTIEYFKPARLDDALVVETRIAEVGAAQGIMAQRISRGDDVLVEARVRAAFLGGDGRPRRVPADVRKAFVDLMMTANDGEHVGR